MAEKILVIGSMGQIGTELVEALRKKNGEKNVLSADIKPNPSDPYYIELNALDKDKIFETVKKEGITQVYLLAALLSATAEKNPAFAWDLNMNSLFHVLNLAKEKHIQKIYWPSSIAVFGPTTPRVHTPQYTVMEPSTVYGISKQAGERWCEYYHHKFGVDVRGLRYPGLIGYKALPGGGTTDYAVDIFHQAKSKGSYECFLKENTPLPMMYMDDAIRATLQLMDADPKKLTVWSSYNLAGISFTPAEIAAEIKKHIPSFNITYNPDFRQAIADSWPGSIDDSVAVRDWNWKPDFNLGTMVETMLKNVVPVTKPN
jgi:nucleoside-diphosphate-sugar epimerase